jgi:hypothetical protein
VWVSKRWGGWVMALKEFELTFGDIVRAICKRPEMYLMHGTFGEALAFLDGYANGRRLGNKGRSSSYFNPFRNWLANRLELQEEGDFWIRFRNTYDDDQTACREFARYWSDYEKLVEEENAT